MSTFHSPAVYAIVNIKTFHHYIGQTEYIHARKSQHFTSLKAGIHHSKLLQAAYNIDPESLKFFVLEECNVKQLTERERYWIKETRPEYNICHMAKFRPRPVPKKRIRFSRHPVYWKMFAPTRCKPQSIRSQAKALGVPYHIALDRARKGQPLTSPPGPRPAVYVVTVDGITAPISRHAKRIGVVSRHIALDRYKKGWSAEDAVKTPKGEKP